MAVNPTPMTHPLVRGAGDLTALVTDLAGYDPGYLDPAEKETALAALGRAADQLAALYGRVLANAEDLVTETGDRNIAAWAERTQHADYSAVARAVRHGEALDRRWPQLQAACLDGRVNQAQAHVIVKSLDGLPDRLGPALRAKAEVHLVEQAAHFSPRALKRLGEHLLEVLAPEIADKEEQRKLEAEERAARRTTRLTMRVRGDGSTDIAIRVPDHVASRLKVYLEAISAPRRSHLDPDSGSDPAGGAFGEPGGGSEVERLPYPRRLGEAFCTLLEQLPAQALPQHGGTATTVMVTIDLDQLNAGLGAAGLATGDRITAAEARRLACTAQIIPVVLGGDSEILDLGRSRRLFSPAQRKALVIRDRRCRAQGCEIPAAWCEAHHAETPWASGGKTDLKDGVLLCSWHHHRAHDPRFGTDRLANGDVRFTRRT